MKTRHLLPPPHLPAPELFDATPMRTRPGRPVGRVIVSAEPDPAGPAFFEWELRAQEWSDEHQHDEFVYVLDGELHVTVDGTTVVAGPGAVVKVPAGTRGFYAAPVNCSSSTPTKSANG